MHELEEATIYRRRWAALAVLSLSLIIIGLDNTVLNVALPHLAESLGASNSQLQWIVDGYVIVFAGLILTMGSLGDRFGRKGALSVGLLIFMAGSIAAMFATSASTLIAFRMVMGIGGALIMPATLSLLTNIFHDPKERARAIGVWAGASAVGIAIGPIIGGLLLAHFWWGSVFFINVPVACVALVSGRFLLPRSSDPAAPKIDPFGAVLSVLTLVTLVWGLIEAPSKGWTSSPILGAFGIGGVFLALFIAWELHSDHPMLEMRFFTNPRFSAANAGVTLVFFAMFGSSFLLTQQLQFVMGYSALKAGLAMTPVAIPLMILGPLSARFVERLGTKVVVGSGLVLTAIGLASMSRLTVTSGYLALLIPMLVMACGMGLTMGPATESIMGSIPRDKAGVGSAMNDTTRQVGGALGVAVVGSVLASVYRPHVIEHLRSTVLGTTAAGHGPLADQANQAIGLIRGQLGAAYAVADRLPGGADGPLGAPVVHAARAAFVDGFGRAVLVASFAALIGAIVVFAFLPARGDDSLADGTAPKNSANASTNATTANDSGATSHAGHDQGRDVGEPVLIGAEES